MAPPGRLSADGILYDIAGLDRLVRVTFKQGDEADSFAAQFGGQVTQPR
jgi:hypothetical protein